MILLLNVLFCSLIFLYFSLVAAPPLICLRATILGKYIAETNATVRCCAKIFGVSKSTVHKDVSERLRDIDLILYVKVRKVLDENVAQRHIRGGAATSEKYKKIREQKRTFNNNITA